MSEHTPSTDVPSEDVNVDEVDAATGEPIGLEQVDAPQQVPMGDDVGGPDVARDTDDPDAVTDTVDVPTDDLLVQGGE